MNTGKHTIIIYIWPCVGVTDNSKSLFPTKQPPFRISSPHPHPLKNKSMINLKKYRNTMKKLNLQCT